MLQNSDSWSVKASIAHSRLGLCRAALVDVPNALRGDLCIRLRALRFVLPLPHGYSSHKLGTSTYYRVAVVLFGYAIPSIAPGTVTHRVCASNTYKALEFLNSFLYTIPRPTHRPTHTLHFANSLPKLYILHPYPSKWLDVSDTFAASAVYPTFHDWFELSS